MTDAAGALYCDFLFSGGKSVVLPYADVIHLRRNFNSNDLLGDRNEALEPALQLAHTQNEGIISAINSGATLRGILKRTQLANVEKLKDIQENFIKDYLTISNNGGIAVIDNASEYIPLDNKPYTIDEKQLQAVKTKIYDYLGISEAIVNSSYDENQWAAFYESTIEPLAVQFSIEFTRKIFNERERAFGNSILFESGRLQFSSNATKVNLIKELMPYGLLTINQVIKKTIYTPQPNELKGGETPGGRQPFLSPLGFRVGGGVKWQNLGGDKMPAGENTEKLKNMRKLKRLLKLVPADRKAVAEKLIAEIAFMEDTLNGLRRHVEENGAIDHFKQGQQEFDRESPAVKTYNTMIQRYSLIYRQLTITIQCCAGVCQILAYRRTETGT